jgi:integrase
MSEGELKRAGQSKDGRKRWQTRIVARHPETGAKVLDTVRFVLGETKGDAQKAKEALRDELLAKKLGRLGKVSRIKFADACDAWWKTLDRYGTQRTYKSVAKKLKEQFGERWIDSLEVGEMQRYLTRMIGEFETSTVGTYRSVIVNTFEWAADHGHIKRPTQAELTKVKRKREVYDDDAVPAKKGLTVEELSRFLPALERIDPYAHKLVLTMLVLGCRFAEGSALKRKDVDWRTGEVFIRRGQVSGRVGPPKNGKPRRAAVPLPVLETLRGHVAEMDRLKWPGHEDLVFPATRLHKGGTPRTHSFWHLNMLSRRIEAALEEIGVETVTRTHLCRHTLNGLLRGQVADSMLLSVVGHTAGVNVKYGDAQVISFAAKVEEVMLQKRGERDG